MFCLMLRKHQRGNLGSLIGRRPQQRWPRKLTKTIKTMNHNKELRVADAEKFAASSFGPTGQWSGMKINMSPVLEDMVAFRLLDGGQRSAPVKICKICS